MFFVNYRDTDGLIGSYSEGPDASQNLAPVGYSTLSFSVPFMGMFDTNFNVIMKINLETKQLEYINPPVIPQPIAFTGSAS